MALATGTFYGYVKDSGNAVTTCSVTVAATTSSQACPSVYSTYSGGSYDCRKQGLCAKYACSQWTLSGVKCIKTVCEDDGGYISCYDITTSAYCKTYNYSYANKVTSYNCASGYKKLNNSYCYN